MQWLLKNKNELLVWLICFAALFGPAFALFSEYAYDLSANPDIKTYLQIAQFDFDESLVRRYRILVPAAAAAVNLLLGPLLEHLQPWQFPGPDFSLGFSFLLINCSIMALAGLFIYRLLKSYQIPALQTGIALLLFLTCRWTGYFAGLPLVDSLYFLVLCIMLYALRTGNKGLLILCLFVGPWAKESFVLFLPVLLFFCPLKLWKLLVFSALGLLPYLLFRLWVDMHLGTESSSSVQADLQHFNYVVPGLKRMFSFHGLYELWSIVGFWGMAYLAFISTQTRRQLKSIEFYHWFFLVIVGLHALLSNELARMYYLALPILCLLFAMSLNGIKCFVSKDYR